MQYDIFISYKRKSLPTANNLYYRLTTRGYSTFFDLEEMGRDNFNTQLLNYIENAKDVFVILEEGSLDACEREDWEKDWFCHEIAFALEKKKNIIPILLNGYKMPPVDFFPDELKEFHLKQAPEFNFTFFEAYLDKLVEKEYLLSKPNIQDKTASVFKFYSNENCQVFKEGKLVCSLEGMSDIPYYLPVPRKGDYRFKVVNVITGESRQLNERIGTSEEKIVDITWIDAKKEKVVKIEKTMSTLSPDPTLPNLKLKADLDCVFYLDGKETAKLIAGKLSSIPLTEGEYELKFVSEENAKDFVAEDTFKIPHHDKRYDVKLLPIREKRLEQERIEKICRIVPDGLIFTVNGVEFKMVKVEGGMFWMGADKGVRVRTINKEEKGTFGKRVVQIQEEYIDETVQNYDPLAYKEEGPVHSVTLSSFYFGETEVSQALWKAVMGKNNNPSHFKGDNLPVEQVSWNDCNDFIRKLNRLTNRDFRLPTEAEWEYAARGGVNKEDYSTCSADGIPYGSGKMTHEIKAMIPNSLGIFDIRDNVWEWCSDWYGEYSNDSVTNPKGPSEGKGRIVRGGSWGCPSRYCRVSDRGCYGIDHKSDQGGFRLVLS